MNIYSILSTKEHNPHYLNRYIKFIMWCQENNKELLKRTTQTPEGTYLEAHHIAPKAKDLFPEYSSFKKNPWNKILLTARQHYLAHMILWKAYGGSQLEAFWKFQTPSSKNRIYYKKITSKMFAILKEEKSIRQSIIMKGNSFWRNGFDENNNKKKPFPPEFKKGENHHYFGLKRKAEDKKKISKSMLGNSNSKGKRQILTCPHCGVSSKSMVIHRWHFDNCKILNQSRIGE